MSLSQDTLNAISTASMWLKNGNGKVCFGAEADVCMWRTDAGGLAVGGDLHVEGDLVADGAPTDAPTTAAPTASPTKSPTLSFCAAGHTDNEDGTCSAVFAIAQVEDDWTSRGDADDATGRGTDALHTCTTRKNCWGGGANNDHCLQRWQTSSIPNDAIIQRAAVKGFMYRSSNLQGRSVHCYYKNWGPTFSNADHAIAGTELSCLAKAGNDIHPASGAVRELELDNAAQGVNTEGYTELAWLLSGATPGCNDDYHWAIKAYENTDSDAYIPELLVTYANPSPATPVHVVTGAGGAIAAVLSTSAAPFLQFTDQAGGTFRVEMTPTHCSNGKKDEDRGEECVDGGGPCSGVKTCVQPLFALYASGSAGNAAFTDSGPWGHAVATVGGVAETCDTRVGGSSAATSIRLTSQSGGQRLTIAGSKETLCPTHTPEGNEHDFTVEMWVKVGSESRRRMGLLSHRCKGCSSINDGGWFWNLDHGKIGWGGTIASTWYDGNQGSTFKGSTDIRDGGWHHVAVSRAGTKYFGFVDGALEFEEDKPGATCNPTCDICNDLDLAVGDNAYNYEGSGSTQFDGWMDAIVITPMAKWTKDFVPVIDWTGDSTGC